MSRSFVFYVLNLDPEGLRFQVEDEDDRTPVSVAEEADSLSGGGGVVDRVSSFQTRHLPDSSTRRKSCVPLSRRGAERGSETPRYTQVGPYS